MYKKTFRLCLRKTKFRLILFQWIHDESVTFVAEMSAINIKSNLSVLTAKFLLKSRPLERLRGLLVIADCESCNVCPLTCLFLLLNDFLLVNAFIVMTPLILRIKIKRCETPFLKLL